MSHRQQGRDGVRPPRLQNSRPRNATCLYWLLAACPALGQSAGQLRRKTTHTPQSPGMNSAQRKTERSPEIRLLSGPRWREATSSLRGSRVNGTRAGSPCPARLCPEALAGAWGTQGRLGDAWVILNGRLVLSGFQARRADEKPV